MIGELCIKQSNSGTSYLAICVPKKAVERHLDTLKIYIDNNGKFNALIENKLKRDGDEYHITVLYGQECTSLPPATLNELIGQEMEFQIDGLGKAQAGESEAYFCIVSSTPTSSLIRNLGCTPKDLHITLGFINSDVHGVRKDQSSSIEKS